MHLAVFSVSEDDLSCSQIDISVLNVADSGSTAATVEKEVDDRPVAVFAEVTVCFWFSEQLLQFFIGVSGLDGFFVFDVGQPQRGQPFFVAPLQEGAKHPCVACDGIVCQTVFSHGHNHVVKMFFCKLIEWNSCVKMFGNTEEVTVVCFDGALADSLCELCGDEPRKYILNGCVRCGFYDAFSCHNWTPCLSEKWSRRQGV